jgi:CubicO group peptidase (beta-lactamase class C family)
LEREKKINWEDKLCQYLPQFCAGEKANITISNLLHHTSGLHELTALGNFDEKNFYAKDSIVAMIANAPLNFLPGTQYAYSNSNFYLLGIIAEKLTGISYDSLLREKILTPLKMNNTGLDHEGLTLTKRSTAYVRQKGKTFSAAYLNMETPFSAGGMYSTANDLLKWSQFFQKQLAENVSLHRLLTTSVAGSDTNLYSAGWCILSNEILHTGHINGFANLISIDTLHHRTIIILSNSDYNKLYVLEETIVSILNNNKNALQWTSGKLHDELPDEYTGSFQNNNLVVTVKNENGKLMSYVNGMPFQLQPLRKDVFFVNDIDGDIIFERNKNNEIVSVKSFQDYSFIRFKKIK